MRVAWLVSGLGYWLMAAWGFVKCFQEHDAWWILPSVGAIFLGLVSIRIARRALR